ncbi:MAG: NUDIX hydrolase N-terminal domain-containing protein [Chloroflexi bacterium]|nr:NUDIX hydrolase N-terminal domain-containing protein [Chloroflexota bacterium]
MTTIPDKLTFLEQLRAIAQLGLNYSHDPHDRQRFKKLLDLALQGYAGEFGLPITELSHRFAHEVGHVTPKVGVNAVIFGPEGKLFLTRRRDDQCWELPGGWADLGESPREALRRELIEETGMRVRPRQLIDVHHRLPGDMGQPHTSYHLTFHCTIESGEFRPSDETLEAGYFAAAAALNWHRDHQQMALQAAFWYQQSYWSLELEERARGNYSGSSSEL